MYKVLVVDDFAVDRTLMIHALDGLPIEVAGECQNGIEALELIRDLKPDILICDIEMPHMNGLELADALQAAGLSMHIIYCSLYNKLTYLQSAIALKCDAYLLKPFSGEELRCSVRHVIGLIAEREEQMREMAELKRLMAENRKQLVSNLYSDLILGNIQHEGELARKAALLGQRVAGQYQLALIEMDEPAQPAYQSPCHDSLMLSYRVYLMVQSIVGDQPDRQIVRLSDRQYVIVARFEPDAAAQACTRAVQALCERLITQLREMGISVSATFSDAASSPMKIRALCEQCGYRIRYKSVVGVGQLIYPTEVPDSVPGAEIDLIALQKEIRFLLNSAAHDIGPDIERLIQDGRARLNPIQLQILLQYIVLCVQIVLQEGNLRISDVCGEEHVVWQKFFELQSPEEHQRWVRMIVAVSHEYLRSRNDDRKRHFVQDVKAHIESADLRAVSIGSVAEHFSYSPNYINHVFKDETGMTILDYITLCRIARAKELLRVSGMKLSDIADQLGYSYASYFSSVFKKIEGISPKAYAERKP
ncbi:MAG: response regulator [Clostridiales bacterium]|nr:response regulator [Clostridiales bacterium]